MKKIDFKDGQALAVYREYIARIEKMLEGLSPAERTDILMEFNSHIFEGLSERRSDGELSAITRVTAELGSPETVLAPLVEGKEIFPGGAGASAVVPGRPGVMGSGPKRVVSYLALSLLYFFMSLLVLLSVAKLFLPTKVGLWYSGRAFKGFGMELGTIGREGIRDVLGHWFIPIAAIICCLLYLAIRAVNGKKRIK